MLLHSDQGFLGHLAYKIWQQHPQQLHCQNQGLKIMRTSYHTSTTGSVEHELHLLHSENRLASVRVIDDVMPNECT